MNKVKGTQIERYYYYDNRKGVKYRFWYVDIADADNMGNTVSMFEAYLRPMNSGVSVFMFGVPKKQENGQDVDYDGFLEMVENNILDYIDVWEEEL